MADAPAKKSSGKGLKKKLGPLPYWGWALVGAGTFLGYRYLKDRSAANAALAASGLTGGTTIPDDTGTTTATTTGAGSFVSQAAWEQAMLTFLTSSSGLDPADALNAVTSWLNGNCVTQAGYNAISAAIVSTSVGLPPGYTNIPTLSVCANPGGGGGTTTTTTTAPTAPPAALPWINAQLYPIKLLFGQYSSGDYTKIGTVVNGQYQGLNVAGGAPVYAGLFGGLEQDFDLATLPSGTSIYVPTSLLNYTYANGSPTPTTAPAPAGQSQEKVGA